MFKKWYHYILYYVLIVGILVFAINVDAKTKHPIYNQIISNSPSINKAYAMKLSNIIYKKTRKYKVNARLFTAILAQETMYKLSQGSCSTGYIKIDMEYLTAAISLEMKNKLRDYTNSKVTICEDFGIGQVNHRNIAKFEMDKERLLTDLDYSVDMAAFMLNLTKKYYSKKDSEWFTRYNAFSKDKRKKYKSLVERFL